METSQDLRTLISEGINLLNDGDKSRALAHFVVATQLQPDDEKLWALRAESTDDPNEAMQCWERVLEINPDNAEAREKLVFLRVHSLQEEARDTTTVNPPEQIKPGITLPPFRILVITFALFFCIASGLALGVFAISQSFGANPSSVKQAVAATPTLALPTYPPTWTPQPTQTPLPPFTVAPPPTYRVVRDVTMRAGPSTLFEALGVVKQDQRVLVIAKTQDGKYLQIEIPNTSARGWVAADYIEMNAADKGNLTVASNVPTPRPAQSQQVKPTAAPANTNTPAPLFDFELSRPPAPVSDCNRQTSVIGTVYTNKNNFQGLNGVIVRVSAFGQVQATLQTGMKNQAGYWEWHFAPNSTIAGEVQLVDAGGNPRSPVVKFNLSPCNGGTNQVAIDFVGTR